MNLLRLITLIALALAMAGCASVQRAAVAEPVGPAPVGRASMLPGGALIVYTATEQHEEGGDTYYYPHVGYHIYAEDGRLVKYVPNHVGFTDEAPAIVNLSAGRYTLRPRWTPRPTRGNC